MTYKAIMCWWDVKPYSINQSCVLRKSCMRFNQTNFTSISLDFMTKKLAELTFS